MARHGEAVGRITFSHLLKYKSNAVLPALVRSLRLSLQVFHKYRPHPLSIGQLFIDLKTIPCQLRMGWFDNGAVGHNHSRLPEDVEKEAGYWAQIYRSPDLPCARRRLVAEAWASFSWYAALTLDGLERNLLPSFESLGIGQAGYDSGISPVRLLQQRFTFLDASGWDNRPEEASQKLPFPLLSQSK